MPGCDHVPGTLGTRGRSSPPRTGNRAKIGLPLCGGVGYLPPGKLQKICPAPGSPKLQRNVLIKSIYLRLLAALRGDTRLGVEFGGRETNFM